MALLKKRENLLLGDKPGEKSGNASSTDVGSSGLTMSDPNYSTDNSAMSGSDIADPSSHVLESRTNLTLRLKDRERREKNAKAIEAISRQYLEDSEILRPDRANQSWILSPTQSPKNNATSPKSSPKNTVLLL